MNPPIDHSDDLKTRIQESWMSKNICFDFDFKAGFDNIKSGSNIYDDRVSNLYNRFCLAVQIMVHSWCKSKLDTEKLATRWFENLLILHSSENRAYHTFCHVEEMIGYIDLLLPKDDDKGRVGIPLFEEMRAQNSVTLLSIFFHDAIYDGKSKTNEEDSLSLYQKFEKEVHQYILQKQRINNGKNMIEVPDQWQFSTKVSIFILATKSHNLDDIKLDSDDHMGLTHLKAFLDADMAVLGKHCDAYNHYASLIRKEYIHVEHALYCRTRAEVLQSFVIELKNCSGKSHETNVQPKERFIFSSKLMRDALEKRAINNVQYEINMLKQGKIPGAS